MKKLFIPLVITFLAALPAHAQEDTTYEEFKARVECNKNLDVSQAKKIFESEYKGKQFIWAGEAEADARFRSNGLSTVMLDIDGVGSGDIRVIFNKRSSSAGGAIKKGDLVVVAFWMESLGGCLTMHRGVDADLVGFPATR